MLLTDVPVSILIGLPRLLDFPRAASAAEINQLV